MSDVTHYVPLSDEPFGICGKHAPLCSDQWSKVTCPDCQNLKPAHLRYDAQINIAISENYPMYFVRRGFWTVELRAVSYRFENGNERSRLLKSFDIRSDIEKIIRLGIDLKARLPVTVAPDLSVLDSFFWDGTIAKPVNAYVSEYSKVDPEVSI